MAWCRRPDAEEVRRGVRFLHAQAERLQRVTSSGLLDAKAAWTAALEDFCLALLESNEFLYVD
jgi:hypothetical protein